MRMEGDAAAGSGHVKGAATQGRRCRQRLFGGPDASTTVRIAATRDARCSNSVLGKAKASCLGVGSSLGARENRMAAEIE
jgi:hypothetical protein